MADNFENIVQKLLRQITTNREETLSLTKQRDELLPLLMNELQNVEITEHSGDSVKRKEETEDLLSAFISAKKDRNLIFKTPGTNLKYNFQIKTEGNYAVEITLQIDDSKENKIMEYIGFEKFTNKKKQALLDCYLKETFMYSNFEKFNNPKDIEFYSNPIITHNNICIINSGVRNKNKLALKIKGKYQNSAS